MYKERLGKFVGPYEEKAKRTPYCYPQLPNRRIGRKWSQTPFGGPQ